MAVDMNLQPPDPPNRGVLRPWEGGNKFPPRNPNLLDYREELQITGHNLSCPVCDEARSNMGNSMHVGCMTCAMWEARIEGGYFQRLCLVEIAFVSFGDSKRKQNQRIKLRDRAVEEARKLWAFKDHDIHHFGVIHPDDFHTVGVMADCLDDYDCPLNAKAARALAEARRTKMSVPALIVPEMKFPNRVPEIQNHGMVKPPE